MTKPPSRKLWIEGNRVVYKPRPDYFGPGGPQLLKQALIDHQVIWGHFLDSPNGYRLRAIGVRFYAGMGQHLGRNTLAIAACKQFVYLKPLLHAATRLPTVLNPNRIASFWLIHGLLPFSGDELIYPREVLSESSEGDSPPAEPDAG